MSSFVVDDGEGDPDAAAQEVQAQKAYLVTLKMTGQSVKYPVTHR